MVKEYFYEKTGMYIDWDQLERLPNVETIIDIGIGDIGTQWLWEKYSGKRIICIDPLYEAKEVAEKMLKDQNFSFHQYAVGTSDQNMTINVEKEIGRSTLLEVTECNFEENPVEKREIPIKPLDRIIEQANCEGTYGIKIDTEGYELEVIKSATETLKKTKFVLAEVRHNHNSFKDQYNLGEFMALMQDNGFVPTIIFTAKPLIADICFQPRLDL